MKKAKLLPSVDLLELVFAYDPVSGLITAIKTGNVIGTVKRSGHFEVHYKNKGYSAARVAWKLYYRKDPGCDYQVIHLDGNVTNNNINNLARKAITLRKNKV